MDYTRENYGSCKEKEVRKEAENRGKVKRENKEGERIDVDDFL